MSQEHHQHHHACLAPKPSKETLEWFQELQTGWDPRCPEQMRLLDLFFTPGPNRSDGELSLGEIRAKIKIAMEILSKGFCSFSTLHTLLMGFRNALAATMQVDETSREQNGLPAPNIVCEDINFCIMFAKREKHSIECITYVLEWLKLLEHQEKRRLSVVW
jgi:hypothetical protein